MIVLLEKQDAEFVIKRFLSYENTNFTMKILATFSVKDETSNESLNKFTLLSLDYIGCLNRELSLITYKKYEDDFTKDNKCDRCHKKNSVLVFHDSYNGMDPIYTCYCPECLEQQTKSTTSLFNLKFILNNLINKNNQEILDYIFSKATNKFYGYDIQKATIDGSNYYYLDINDVFTTIWFSKSFNSFITYHLDDPFDLYICNYLIFVNYISNIDSKKFFIGKLLKIIPDTKIEYRKKFIQDLSVDLLESLVCSTTKDLAKQKQITVKHSRYKNALFGKVGTTYKDVHVKLIQIEKDNSDFFKGRYKYLYLLYFGYYNLYWNTNKLIENGNYTCDFKVTKHVTFHDYTYTFIQNCKLKIRSEVIT